jgi:hypothetical protein
MRTEVRASVVKCNGEHEMTQILFVGQQPETVDFSDPSLPSGFNADTAAPMVEHQLASKRYDGVVIGGGIRLPPKRLLLFEALINAVHLMAQGAFIAFNTRPEDSADAAARWVKAG